MMYLTRCKIATISSFNSRLHKNDKYYEFCSFENIQCSLYSDPYFSFPCRSKDKILK